MQPPAMKQNSNAPYSVDLEHRDLWQLATIAPQPRIIGRLEQLLNHRLQSAPRIVVLGETNSGKSALVDVLIGAPALPPGLEALAGLPTRVFHAPSQQLTVEMANGLKHDACANGAHAHDLASLADARTLHVGLPQPRLKSFELIDTAPVQSSDSPPCDRVVDACRQAHLAIWCTTAMQAWKASEQGAWGCLPQRLKSNAILAVTFKDAIQSGDDEARLLGRLRVQAAPHFQQVVVVSNRDAINARTQACSIQSERRWHLSGGAEMCAAVDASVSALVAKRARIAQERLAATLTRSGAAPMR